MVVDATDALVRRAAFAHVQALVERDGDVLSWSTLTAGFEFRGERVHLLSQQGIFTPRQCRQPLSIRTSANSPYGDSIGEGDTLRYAYRGTDPAHRDNVGLHETMHDRTPLIYFHSVVQGHYLAVLPVFVVRADPKALMFDVQVDEPSAIAPMREGAKVNDADEPIRRRYATIVTRRRLFQRTFRERVLDAYRRSCALCRLKHEPLLDAAHILPDADARGEPRVSNGLSLCKIHHAAFDRDILGIDPDGRARIRADILEEVNGPMLRHGLQEMHGVALRLPRRAQLRPDRDALAERFEAFLKAG